MSYNISSSQSSFEDCALYLPKNEIYTDLTEIEVLSLQVISIYGTPRTKSEWACDINYLLSMVNSGKRIEQGSIVRSINSLLKRYLLIDGIGRGNGICSGVMNEVAIEALKYPKLLKAFSMLFASRAFFYDKDYAYRIILLTQSLTIFKNKRFELYNISYSTICEQVRLVGGIKFITPLYELFENASYESKDVDIEEFEKNLITTYINNLKFNISEIDDLIEWISKREGTTIYEAFYPLIAHIAILGKPSDIPRVVELFKMPKEFLFIYDLFNGNLKEAEAKAEDLLILVQCSKNHTRKELPHVIGGFYAILLLKSGEARKNKDALTFIRNSLKLVKGEAIKSTVSEQFLTILLDYGLAKQKGQEPKYFAQTWITFDPIQTLLITTLDRWLNESSKLDTNITKLFPQLINSENIRVELEIRTYISNTSGDKEKGSAKRLTDLRSELDFTPLVDMFQPAAIWEDILGVIETVALTTNSKSSSEKVKKNRLIWKVDFEYLEIEVVEQKLQKKGWSKGGPKSLRALYGNTPESATPTDISIINCIEKSPKWSHYTLNWDKALPLFIGHPYLYTLEEPNLPLELAKEQVEIVVKERDGETEINFSHDITQPRVERIDDTHFNYIEWSPEIEKIALALINRGVKSIAIPKSEKKRVKKALLNLSGKVALQGDFEDPNLTKVDGEAEIFVQLSPIDNKLVVNLLAKVIKDGKLTVIPGKGRPVVTTSDDKKKIQVTRNLDLEVKNREILISKIPTLSLVEIEEEDMILDSDADALKLLSELKEFSPETDIKWPKGEKLRISKVISSADVNLSVNSENDWFKFSGNVSIDQENVLSLKALIELSENGTKEYISLDSDSFIKLSRDLSRRLFELSSIQESSGDSSLRVHNLGANALKPLIDGAKSFKSDAEWRANQERLERLAQFTPELPSNLNAELRPYQLEGYNWLSRLYAWGVGGCLADDMGLGKTIQAIALMLKQAHNGPSLVLAPSSVCPNWIKEILKFAPTLRCHTLQNSNRLKTINGLKEFDVLIATYGLIQSNPDLLADKEWNIVTLDEAHAIKNANSMRSKAAMKLQAKFRLITTGTPIQNHLGELWNLFQFINPGFLGKYNQFNQRFIIGESVAVVTKKRKALNRYIGPFILRRNKTDVLDDLPEKTEITLTVDLSADERDFYEALRVRAVEEIERSEEDNKQHMQILAQLTKLRLASCNTRLADPTIDLPSSKMDILEELVVNLLEAKHKALIFSQFTSHLALIKEMLDRKGISYQYLDGSVSSKNREKAILNFQAGESDLFLISLKAGGVGLNLTAADYVIHMDPWWNPAIEDQASDRVYRIGQTRPVTIYRLVAKGTIEEKIVSLHHKKRDLADNLLANSDRSAKISSKELFELISK